MKQNHLDKYRVFLHENFAHNTAEAYYFAVKRLLLGVVYEDILDLSGSFFENQMLKIKNKNDFSAAKNGLVWMQKLYPQMRIPTEEFFRKQSIKKRNWSKKPKNVISLDQTKRKINALKNNKLKLAFRLAMASGLRVSELSHVAKEDINIKGGLIEVNVTHGKGGSNGTVECMEDLYLVEKLSEYMADKAEGEKLFYSASTMKRKALELGLQCHDLRRIAAITYRNERKKEVTADEANQDTKKFLRHVRFSTTKRYLFNKKLKFK